MSQIETTRNTNTQSKYILDSENGVPPQSRENSPHRYSLVRLSKRRGKGWQLHNNKFGRKAKTPDKLRHLENTSRRLPKQLELAGHPGQGLK